MVCVRHLAQRYTPEGEKSIDEFRIMLADALGVCNYTGSQAAALDAAIRRAERRKIVFVNANGYVHLYTRSIDDYRSEYEWLVDFVVKCIGRSWKRQENVIVEVARKLGFARTGHVIERTVKGVIRAALRRGLIERDGRCLRRV